MTITPEDLEYLRTIFVTRDACDKKNDRMEKDITEIKLNQASMNSTLKVVLWLAGAILVAILPIALKSLFGA